jgi:F-type H+-transporting ATPase subunit b
LVLAAVLVAAPVGAQHGDDPQPGHAESTGSGPAEAAAPESGGGLMDVNPGLMIWTLVTFVALLTVLRFTAWKPLIGALEAREQRIREAVEQAEKTRRESEALMARHEQQLEAARVEAHQIIDEGKADALRVKDDIVKQARHEAEEGKARALREVQLAADTAKKELWEEATRLSTLLAERILRRSLNDDDDRRLVEQVFDEFRSVRQSSGD